MSTFTDPATIQLRPATEMDSLCGGHILEIGRSHGSHRQLLSTDELRRLRDLIGDYLRTDTPEAEK
jgi:hypothetical protein